MRLPAEPRAGDETLETQNLIYQAAGHSVWKSSQVLLDSGSFGILLEWTRLGPVATKQGVPA